MDIKDESKYLRAKERTEELKKFYTKIVSSIGVVIIVAGINYYTNEWAYPWFLWVVFGLTISLVFEAIKLFSLNSLFGKDWEDRKIKEYMQDEDQRGRKKNRWE